MMSESSKVMLKVRRSRRSKGLHFGKRVPRLVPAHGEMDMSREGAAHLGYVLRKTFEELGAKAMRRMRPGASTITTKMTKQAWMELPFPEEKLRAWAAVADAKVEKLEAHHEEAKALLLVKKVAAYGAEAGAAEEE